MSKYVPNNSPNVLIGNKAIAANLGISVATLSRWRSKHGFPVTTYPDGRVATTHNLIEQWFIVRIGQAGRKNMAPGQPRKYAQSGTESQQSSPADCG